MDRSFYNAASAMMVQQRKLDTLSNNVGNLKTPGYKEEVVTTHTFNDILMSEISEDGIYYTSNGIGGYAPLRVVNEIKQIFEQGAISDTLRPFDVAINGQGFFTIDVDGTSMYTRNGSFSLDDEGYLQLAGYGRVQGTSGDIFLGTDNFSITTEGVIYDAEGNEVDTLDIEWCDNLDDLQKQDNGLFTLEEGAMYAVTTAIKQGALERSAVDLNSQMTKLLEYQSNFQAMSTVIKQIDGLNQLAVNQIGKV